MKLWLLSLMMLTVYWSSSQSLPDELYISGDGKMLLSGKRNTGGFYDSSHIAEVNLQFSQSNYWSLLTANYQSKTEIPATMTVDGATYDGVGIRLKGNTSYNMAGNSQKKSFNVSMDFTDADLEIDGYSTLNFNNSFQDPTFLREVLYARQIRKYVPALKGNFVHLTLNGVDWGIYPNIQQVNKDFYKEWFKNNDGINWRADSPSGIGGGGPGGGPQWGDGTAAINYLGTDTTSYKKYYTLKYSELDNPWQKLVNLCDKLNNTSVADLPNVLPNYLDIDKTLWFLACEIAFGDDDSYVYKGKMDYYIYYDEETNLFNPIEFDGNSAFNSQASSWGPFYNETKVNYPLLNKMLKVPQWRQRYIAHMKTLLEEALNPTTTAAVIDNYKKQIDAFVSSDPKKATTYAQFTSGINTLKTWVTSRYNNFKNNSEIKSESPEITDVNYISYNGSWAAPYSDQAVTVTAKASSTSGISQLNLYYDNSLWGNFSALAMYDDGTHNDGVAGDGIYAAEIPAQATGDWVRFYIEAIANNASKSVAYAPLGAEHDVYIYQVVPQQSVSTTVVINELMASNTNTVTDESGAFEDWIELFNTTANDIDLSGYFLTDNPTNPDKWQFAEGTIIPAGGYYIIWADEDSSTDPTDHCNFKLSKDGEDVLLLNSSLEIIDQLTFGAQVSDMSYARSPNGTGDFVIKAATFNANNDGITGTDAEWSQTFKIYPNPTNDGFYVNFDGEEERNYEVYNTVGKIISKGSLSLSNTFIETYNWPSGMYIFKSKNNTEKINITH